MQRWGPGWGQGCSRARTGIADAAAPVSTQLCPAEPAVRFPPAVAGARAHPCGAAAAAGAPGSAEGSAQRAAGGPVAAEGQLPRRHPGLVAATRDLLGCLQAFHLCKQAPCLQDEDQEGQRRRQPKPGEAGFRYHATIPQVPASLGLPPGLWLKQSRRTVVSRPATGHPSKLGTTASPTSTHSTCPSPYVPLQPASLDYIKAPVSRFAVPEGKAAGKGKEEHRLAKKLKGMAKSKQAGRAAKVSVEGRNVTIQH